MRFEIPWRLDLGPRSVLTIELTRGLDADAGVLVEDEPTLAALADLRSGAGNAYDVLVRDLQGRVRGLVAKRSSAGTAVRKH